MTDCSEIERIVKDSNRENLTIDFKKSDILKSKEGQKKLLEHIVSFANREPTIWEKHPEITLILFSISPNDFLFQSLNLIGQSY